MKRFFAAAALASLLAVACTERAPGPLADRIVEPAAVGEIEVVREALVEPIHATGSIAPEKLTNVGLRVDGIIEEIFVHVGSRVSQGDPLFRTRKVDYELRLAETQAALRLARAEAARALRDLERLETLVGRGVASTERLDDARTDREIALARLETGHAAAARAQQDLADTLVSAPYDGVITQKFVDEGTFMRTMMTSNSPVIQIMKTDIVVALVKVPAIHLPRIRVGTPARVEIDGMEREFETQVHVVNDRIDASSRSIDVRLGIENPDLAIKPGLFARAELSPEPRELVVVPRASVLGPSNARYVLLDDGGVARRRDVRVRELDTHRMEVVDGLTPGERVLSGPNLPRLSDGSPIAIELAHANR